MPIALFIDGSFAYKTARPLGLGVDYLRLRQFTERTLSDQVDEAYYFNADTDPPKAEAFHNSLRMPPPHGPGLRVKCYWLQTKKLYWPEFLGGGPVVHPSGSGVQYEQTSQKGVDVGLIYHLIRSYMNRRWTKLMLVAGDADFHEPVQNLVEQYNVDLYLVGTMRGISGELRPYARHVYEMDDPAVAKEFCRPVDHQPAQAAIPSSTAYVPPAAATHPTPAPHTKPPELPWIDAEVTKLNASGAGWVLTPKFAEEIFFSKFNYPSIERVLPSIAVGARVRVRVDQTKAKPIVVDMEKM